MNGYNYNFAVGDLTPAGAYTGASSPYGTYDQGGNVWEWNESLVSGVFRGIRGGSWHDTQAYLSSSTNGYFGPTDDSSSVGFRIATIPEPSTLALSAASLAALAACARRRRSRRTVPCQ